MTTRPLDEAGLRALIEAATAAAARAYAPYSGYRVGAALRTTDGPIFIGCNVENASYPAGICAERAALVAAVSQGHQHFDALVVVSANGGTPCGVCRQMLYEFAPQLWIVIADTGGQVRGEWRLAALLPHGFGPSALAGANPTTA
jgi:cytidine deaminase